MIVRRRTLALGGVMAAVAIASLFRLSRHYSMAIDPGSPADGFRRSLDAALAGIRDRRQAESLFANQGCQPSQVLPAASPLVAASTALPLPSQTTAVLIADCPPLATGRAFKAFFRVHIFLSGDDRVLSHQVTTGFDAS